MMHPGWNRCLDAGRPRSRAVGMHARAVLSRRLSRHERIAATADTTVLRHMRAMSTRDVARLSWPGVYGPGHDALIEDALSTARTSLGEASGRKARSLRAPVPGRARWHGRTPYQAAPPPPAAERPDDFPHSLTRPAPGGGIRP